MQPPCMKPPPFMCLACASKAQRTLPPASPPERKPTSILSPQRDGFQIGSGERIVITRTADGKFEIKSDELIDVGPNRVMTAKGGGPAPAPGPGEIVFSFAGSQATGML